MAVTEQDLLQDLQKPPYWKTLGGLDWLWALLVLAGTAYAYADYRALMDGYEVAILFASGLSLVGLGWGWRPVRPLTLAVAVLSLFALSLYGSRNDAYRL